MALRKRKADADKDAKPGEPRITPKKAKNALAVAKVIGPAVIPVVVPIALRAAAEVRDRIDRRKARRLGVPVGELPQYSGHGGALHARITGAVEAVDALHDRKDATDEDRRFAAGAETRLRQLTAAVRAAERMPSDRRRAAHKAVATELDDLEGRLLNRLGLT
jgi:hypothetical protein